MSWRNPRECEETLNIPVGYDEDAFAFCDLPRGHAGECHWNAS